jgi:ribulose-phosphate 3-epimerase
MTEVVPAIIPSKYADISANVEQVKDYVRRVQVDIIDGVFAPTKTWPFMGDKGEFVELRQNRRTLPYRETIKYSLDMMVAHPMQMLEDWISAGFTSFIIHRESVSDITLEAIIKVLRSQKLEIGIALKPRNEAGDISQFLGQINFIQFMGNDRIGYHGVKLDERVLGKIEGLRKDNPRIIIGVDIGVNSTTAQKLVSAGANRLVSGSLIFESEDIGATITMLKELE